MDLETLQAKVLEHVRREEYQPVKPSIIAAQLGLEEEAKLVRRAVKKLIKRGELRFGDKHLVLVGGRPSRQRLVGTFRRVSSGNGFVRLRPSEPGQEAVNVFISKRRALDAATGDEVVIRIRQRGDQDDDRGPSGEIIEILNRDRHQFVGRYFLAAGEGFVEVAGGHFNQSVYVGDGRAKGAREGDLVLIEMVRFPSSRREGEAVILEVLGARGEPAVDTQAIIYEFGLPQEFPEEALADARAQADAFEPENLEAAARAGRRDLTAETIITIDPIDARDFDDAISLQRIENEHWRLGVHIADVAHFVEPDRPLDREARERATSVYLPDRVIPMLPETISNHLASLQPHRPRLARTVWIEFTAEGARVSADVERTVIESKRRFAYEEVDEYLADPDAWRSKLEPPVHALLGSMHTLAMLLRKRRFARGALELTIPEVKIDLDADGHVAGAHEVQHTESHQIIEEFMLAANEAVAQSLQDRAIQFIRRIHQPPSPRKMQQLTQFVRTLGYRAENLQDRFELQELLDEAHGKPEERAISFAVLRSMQKAIYSPEEEGHYALASRAYCHFTSPIRRYPDLTVHRLFDLLDAGEKPPQDIGKLTVLAEHCSDREQRAESAERELVKIKLLNYMSDRIGTKFEAIVTGVEKFGLFAQGIELPAEGLIHISSLQDDYYFFDDKARVLMGRRAGNQYRLGDRVRVEVVRVDVDRRELDFRIVQAPSRGRVPKPGPGTRGRKPARAGGKRAVKPKKKR